MGCPSKSTPAGLREHMATNRPLPFICAHKNARGEERGVRVERALRTSFFKTSHATRARYASVVARQGAKLSAKKASTTPGACMRWKSEVHRVKFRRKQKAFLHQLLIVQQSCAQCLTFKKRTNCQHERCRSYEQEGFKRKLQPYQEICLDSLGRPVGARCVTRGLGDFLRSDGAPRVEHVD